MDHEMLNVDELATYLRISKSNAYSLVSSSGFPALRINRRILIPKAALIEWVQQNIKNN